VSDLRLQTDVFEDVGARVIQVQDLTFQTGNGPPAHATALAVSYNYLSILGIQPFLGRGFVLDDAVSEPEPEGSEPQPEVSTPEEEVADQGPSVIITYGFWQRAFGGDPDVLERPFSVVGDPARIVGVLPRDFRFLHERRHRWVQGTSVDFFVPVDEQFFTIPGGRGRNVLPLARLRSAVSYAEAQAAMDVLAARFREEYTLHEEEQLRIVLYPLEEDLTAGSRPILLVLSGGVLFLMLLVCANLANLMLVRGRVRSREDAVRATVGCGQVRLMGQRLTESVLLVLGGGVVGIGLAWIAIRTVEVLAPRTVPLLDQITMNGQVLVAGLGASFILVLLFGLIPAIHMSRLDLVRVLNSETRGASGRGRQKLMNGLVVSELALSMVLLVGAAVMVRTLWEMTRADFGFQGEEVLTFNIMPYAEEFRSREAMGNLIQEIEVGLEAIPGVEVVARTSMAPLSGVVWNGIYGWDEESLEQGTERADFTVCTGDYFQAMGTRFLAGRTFSRAEETDSSDAIIVDAKLAGLAWPDEDPIGKRLITRGGSIGGVVVGVVDHMLMRDLGMESFEAIHQPEGRYGTGSAQTFVIRSGVPPETLVPSVRRALSSVHSTLVPFKIWKLSDRVRLSMAPTRFTVFLMGSFAAVAFLVAVTGLFGVIAYAVQTRTAELGVRMALGAEKRRIMSMVLRQGAVLTGIGIVGGVLGAIILSRFLQSMVFGISATDPLVLLAAALLLGVVAILACCAPARWACRLDPARVLRTD
jgi:predicted permease